MTLLEPGNGTALPPILGVSFSLMLWTLTTVTSFAPLPSVGVKWCPR